MPRTYQLYLSTQVLSPASNNVVPVNKTNKANVTWQVNFKTLFGNDYNKYKRCSVRALLISETWNTADTDVANYSGYLAINLPSVSSSFTTLGTPILLLTPSKALSRNPANATDFPPALSYYNCSTMDAAQGVDINLPSENQFMSIQFCNNDSFSLMTTVPEYNIMFQFELSEPVE